MKKNKYNRGYERFGSQMLEVGTAQRARRPYSLASTCSRIIQESFEEITTVARICGRRVWERSLRMWLSNIGVLRVGI